MNLPVTVRMNKGTVLCMIRSSHRFVDDVVVVPTGYFGQWLVTVGADAPLFLPQIRQCLASLQGWRYLYAVALFKIRFPFRIIGVARPLDLHLALDGDGGCLEQRFLGGFSSGIFCCSRERPRSVTDSFKVTVLDPLLPFAWVPPLCPLPQGLEDGVVYMAQGFF